MEGNLVLLTALTNPTSFQLPCSLSSLFLTDAFKLESPPPPCLCNTARSTATS